VIIARRVWLQRNDIVHEGILTHPTQIMLEAQKALEDFQRANVLPINDGQHDKIKG
jgi:hypothetical protein